MDCDLAAVGSNGALQAGCLADPVLNRGTAYTDAERDRPGIEGLLLPRVEGLAVAAAVADVAHGEGLATRARPPDSQAEAARALYRPGYG